LKKFAAIKMLDLYLKGEPIHGGRGDNGEREVE
jgi:hypothetical protein